MKTPAYQRKEGQNPEGGLNAAGRASYHAETGGELRPPVKGAPKSEDDLKRKGAFLVRMGSSKGPLFKDGEKTRLKLSLEAWGHRGDKATAVAKGRRLLERYSLLDVKEHGGGEDE
jgi:hypothetical protein